MTPPADAAKKLARIASSHRSGTKLATFTAYDYPTARLLDESGVDLILVGDSLGMMVHGFEDTVDVTMEMMILHTSACARAVTQALLVSDLPYHSYEDPDQAVHNARRLIDAGAEAVKLEGGVRQRDKIKAIVAGGIPFLGHVGMLPQRVREEGGYRKKGKTPAQREALLEGAAAVEQAGAFAIVLEGIVPDVAAEITARASIPTIGIGSGQDCDGQVLVTNDVLGSFPWFRPPFAKPRADIAGDITRAVREYISATKAGE